MPDMMGAGKIKAFDVDPVAVENAEENVRLNGLTGKIDLICGALDDINRETFDLIIANINRNALLNLAKGFKIVVFLGHSFLLIIFQWNLSALFYKT